MIHLKEHNNFKQNIINIVPKIELSYEHFSHKKVLNFDVLMAIPKGPKSILWITKYNGNNFSFCFILDSKKKITNVFYYKFDNKIRQDLIKDNGTVLYGTLFFTNINKCFTIENVLYNSGKNVAKFSWGEKMIIIDSLLKNNLQSVCDPKIILGVPILSNNCVEFKEMISHSLYGIYQIEYRKFNNYNNSIVTKLSVIIHPSHTSVANLSENIFLVKATIQDDIYELYDTKDINKFIDTAHIPNYNTSVMMNSLFRTIKENANLDALEESDDEEEFQNNDEEQFVSLNISYKIKCIFNKKFKQWQPIEVIQ
jgi:hypothetical protein